MKRAGVGGRPDGNGKQTGGVEHVTEHTLVRKLTNSIQKRHNKKAQPGHIEAHQKQKLKGHLTHQRIETPTRKNGKSV